jgi:hypothetical protein
MWTEQLCNIHHYCYCIYLLSVRHLQICGVIPDQCRERLRSLKGYGSRPVGDSAQYWIDSARELGLDDSTDGLGVTFVTNPLAKVSEEDGTLKVHVPLVVSPN